MNCDMNNVGNHLNGINNMNNMNNINMNSLNNIPNGFMGNTNTFGSLRMYNNNINPDGNGLEYINNLTNSQQQLQQEQQQIQQQLQQYKNGQPIIYTTSVICPLATAIASAANKSLTGTDTVTLSQITNSSFTSTVNTTVTTTATATATEILAFANFRTRTITQSLTTPVTVTATQINAYEVIKIQISRAPVTETVFSYQNYATTTTTTIPQTITVTSQVSVVVPSIYTIAQDIFHSVTIKEPIFQTIIFTPPPQVQVSISALIEKVTETLTITATPVQVVVSTTIIEF